MAKQSGEKGERARQRLLRVERRIRAARCVPLSKLNASILLHRPSAQSSWDYAFRFESYAKTLKLNVADQIKRLSTRHPRFLVRPVFQDDDEVTFICHVYTNDKFSVR